MTDPTQTPVDALAAQARECADSLRLVSQTRRVQDACDVLEQCASTLAAIPAPPDMVEVPITAPGMAKVGDTVCFTLSGKRVRETVKIVLDEGTDREELIYNKRRNYYLITSMCMAGTGSQKDVCVLRKAAPTPPTAPAQDAQGEPIGTVVVTRWDAMSGKPLKLAVSISPDAKLEAGQLVYLRPYVQSELDAATARAKEIVRNLNIEDGPSPQAEKQPMSDEQIDAAWDQFWAGTAPLTSIEARRGWARHIEGIVTKESST